MTRAKNTLLTYIILILLAVAIIASGKLINSLRSEPEKDYVTKLAELRADLIKAAKSGNKQQTSTNKRTSPTSPPKHALREEVDKQTMVSVVKCNQTNLYYKRCWKLGFSANR